MSSLRSGPARPGRLEPIGSREQKEETPIRYLKGVGPRRAEALARLGIRTLGDLWLHLPRGYRDRSAMSRIADLLPGKEGTFRGRVERVNLRRLGGRRTLVEARLADDSGAIICRWFNQPYVAEHLGEGRTCFVTGRPSEYRGRLQMANPIAEPEESEPVHTRRIVPVYPATEGLGPAGLRRLLAEALARLPTSLPETVPESLRKRHRLAGRAAAIRGMHAPTSLREAEAGRRALAYEECLVLQVALGRARRAVRSLPGRSTPVPAAVDARIRKRFPFALTRGQNRAVAEIARDLAAPAPMRRLLQGDVGSGKTAVAAYAMLAVIAANAQAAMMAPTEILATQHFLTLKRILAGSRVRIALRVSGGARAAREEQARAIAAGEVDLVIGTHALLEEGIDFADLALAVIDEQHRFGVLQRSRLRAKGRHPDLLVMTATPIPRTLAMTAYGDLDVSVLDELPPGRTSVATEWIPPARRERAYAHLRAELDAGGQAYIVYPLVAPSEAETHRGLRDAESEAPRIARAIPNHRVALLHGRMEASEKEGVMADFAAGRTRVLVATPVIEVGVDVPNASVMWIEHAERFGLASLHQLRGRVGRGPRPSRCILVGNPRSETARRRLAVMTETTDGFRIAEEDLSLRGPGEVLGTAQHGWPAFRATDPIRDVQILAAAREDARTLLDTDPGLARPEHRPLAAALATRHPAARSAPIG